MEKTLKELTQDALNVQSACNLCAVAQGFARAMIDLRRLFPDTDVLRADPIAILWSDKIAHLTGTQLWGHDRVCQAYAACYALLDRAA